MILMHQVVLQQIYATPYHEQISDSVYVIDEQTNIPYFTSKIRQARVYVCTRNDKGVGNILHTQILLCVTKQVPFVTNIFVKCMRYMYDKAKALTHPIHQ